MIFLCQGLPKSASTFGFQLAKSMAEAAGFEQDAMYATYIQESVAPYRPQPYYVQLSEGDLVALDEELPEPGLLVIKLHGKLYGDIEALLKRGRCRGICTIRDPRDAVVSLYEASFRERRKEAERREAFTRIRSVDQCIDTISARVSDLVPWLGAPDVLVLNYDAIRLDPLGVAERIRDHMELEIDVSKIVGRYLSDKRGILEFNVGVSGRYKTVLDEEQESRVNTALDLLVEYL